jgi:hypothetical protein
MPSDAGRLSEGQPPDRSLARELDHIVAEVVGAGVDLERAPDLLGDLHQGLLSPSHRRRAGVYYTSQVVAGALTRLALSARQPTGAPPLVCDPAAGGGAFLLAAARQLADEGHEPADIVEHLLWGADLDPVAASVAATALRLWSVVRGSPASSTHIVVGDSLVRGGALWPDDRVADGFDVIVGNPPFQGQLGRATARTGAETEELRSSLGATAIGYADTATLFLVRSTRMVRPGGSVSLVLPQSFLAARDAGPARRLVLDAAELVALWWCAEPIFDAGVRVWAPVLRVRRSPIDRVGQSVSVVDRFTGPAVEATSAREWIDGGGDGPSTWAPLVSDLFGTPAVALDERRSLRSISRATAGFRDQYYGLRGHITEGEPDDDGVRLITSGLVEPGRVLWGRRLTSFARVQWERPVVAVADLDPKLRGWAEPLLVPKVVVATQTKVLEAAVDESGSWWPSVPVIAVVPFSPDDLWYLAAVLLAPPVSAWAWARHAGGALARDAIKLAAREVLDLPLPIDRSAWDRGADLVRTIGRARSFEVGQAALVELGGVMCAAYGVDPDPVLDWWSGRLPSRGW